MKARKKSVRFSSCLPSSHPAKVSLRIAWIFKAREEFEIRCDYVFHRLASRWIFSQSCFVPLQSKLSRLLVAAKSMFFQVVRCRQSLQCYSPCLKLFQLVTDDSDPSASTSENLHNNLLLFTSLRGRRKRIVIVVLFWARSDIQFSCHAGYTFICSVITSPCPPTTNEGRSKHFSLISNSAPQKPFLYLELLIARSKRKSTWRTSLENFIILEWRAINRL